MPSTFCWDPVAGCEGPATAIRRADAFALAVPQKGVEDGTFWSAKASDYLRGYFCAAALARYDLRTVASWLAPAASRIRSGTSGSAPAQSRGRRQLMPNEVHVTTSGRRREDDR